ncbi:DUF499 domain-containing protein [Halochromatium salexigens]|uniref:ATP-binding protein n=1 Tax=Halochromatium salexigens TaxID=49447 RepID=A0AAJ0UF93_HALSE|nr:DUF499 domain-containing protein [Halochromatium salexigens]MBK5930386.1 hypothetical protein [Halochromatium salexigens]
MQDVLSSCQPRPEILAGTFNPEIFTARLSRVLTDYAKGQAREGASALYSDPVAFFRDATYPTQGLISILDNVLARLNQGDLSRPAIQRIDNAFGGGKTHTLIALTHAAKQGQALTEPLAGIVPAERLAPPGAIRVVGVIGDTVDTLREGVDGGQPKPNTLWWLIAQDILTPEQQVPIQARLDDASAPGSEAFFDALLGERPTLILIDEIAQYLSRMEAAFPGLGAQQAAAFLMSLSTYTESRPNIAVVISLASVSNAFGDFNKLIRQLKSTHGMSQSQAEAIVSDAQKEMRDVVNRAAGATTPVQEGDLSRIMAKRLFTRVDQDAAVQIADAFTATYRQAGTDLPAEASNPRRHDELIAHYPFHPKLIEFLSQELAQVETFQSTRGLLRTLARAVRRIWEAKLAIPLIQTGHLDLADSTIRGELLGKTGNTDLQAVLDADISKVAGTAATGLSVAGELDHGNPHPDGYPVHEWSWRVVFLHSLVGRGGGLQDEKFGIDLASAVYEMASPAIKPATVHSALAQIESEANYLRNRNGRLYADTVPTLNNILRRIEGNVSDDEALDRVEQVVRTLVDRSAVFDVHANISDGEAIPDKSPKPQLGIIRFETAELDPVRFIEQRGSAIREYQNQVFLLAPSVVYIKESVWNETRTQQERRTRQHILALAHKAIAVERLKANPENWGVSHDQLQKTEFKERAAKSPAELRTAIETSYRYLLFPSRDQGRVATRDLGKGGAGPTAGGSGGLHLEDAILRQLADEGELITEARAPTAETQTLLGKLFFDQYPQVSVSTLVMHFATRRHWPILQRPDLLAPILVEGSKRGAWCLGEMPDPKAHKPTALYHKENPPPLTVEPLAEPGGWILCTKEHAKQLGWLEDIERRPDTVADWLEQTIESRTTLDLEALTASVEQEHDKVDPNVLSQQLTNLLAQRKLVVFPAESFDAAGTPDPDQARTGDSLPLDALKTGIVMPYHEAQARGWISPPKVQQQQFTLRDKDKIKQILNLLAGTALSQSKTQVAMLNIEAQLHDKAPFQFAVSSTTVGDLVDNRALFAALNNRLQFDNNGEVRLTLGEPDPNCKFLSLLKQLEG